MNPSATSLKVYAGVAWLLLTSCPVYADDKERLDALGDPLPPGAIARLGTTRFKNLVADSLALSPDGRWLAGGRRDGTLSIYDLKTAKETHRFKDRYVPITALAFSADSKQLVIGDLKGIEFVDIHTGQQRALAEGYVRNQLAIDPQGRSLAYSGQGIKHYIRVLNADTGAPIHEFATEGATRQLCYAPSGKRLVAVSSLNGAPAGNPRSAVRIWDLDSGEVLEEFRTALWVSGAVSPDSQILALAERDYLQLRGLGDGQIIHRKSGIGQAVVFLPNGKAFAAVSTKPLEVHVIALADGAMIRRFPSSLSSITELRCSGDVLVAAGTGETEIWQLSTGKRLHEFPGHRVGVARLAYAPRGDRLASIGERGDVRIWDIGTSRPKKHRQLTEPPWPPYTAIGFGPGGRELMVWTGGSEIEFIDVTTGDKRKSVTPAHAVGAITLSNDGLVLAAGHSRIIEIYDVPTRKLLFELPLLDSSIRIQSIGLCHDGSKLAVGHTGESRDPAMPDPSLLICDLKTRSLSAALPGHPGMRDPLGHRSLGTYGVAFSPDGRYVATFGRWYEGNLRLWQAAPAKLLFELSWHEPGAKWNTPGVASMAFSPDNRILASGGHDGVIRLWDVLTGQKIGQRGGSAWAVHCLGWSPDGRSFAAGSADGTILIWPAVHAEWKAGTVPLSEAAFKQAWQQLASKNAEIVYAGIRQLVESPSETVEWFKEMLVDIGPRPEFCRRVEKLVKDLHSGDFVTRQAAARELQTLDERAVPLLKAALPEAASLDGRRRLEKILGELEAAPLSPETLQALRAVQVLEWIGGASARSVLEHIATSRVAVQVTETARAAVKRLDALAKR